MSAERLREAAKVLRERAEAEPEWPCAEYMRGSIRHLVRNCDTDCDHLTWNEANEAYDQHECPAPNGTWDRYTTATYIATMRPGVGLALAKWLDFEAGMVETFTRVAAQSRRAEDYALACTGSEALAVADAILGDVE